jgi:hypothetical protein
VRLAGLLGVHPDDLEIESLGCALDAVPSGGGGRQSELPSLVRQSGDIGEGTRASGEVDPSLGDRSTVRIPDDAHDQVSQGQAFQAVRLLNTGAEMRVPEFAVAPPYAWMATPYRTPSTIRYTALPLWPPAVSTS